MTILLYKEQQRKLALCESKASTKDFIRGNYENKIRFFSPPEKIFETFATLKNEDDTLSMSYADFLKAQTPYNYGQIKNTDDYCEKHGDRINKVLQFADSNNDGKISFTEFFFFVSVLQLPKKHVQEDFQKLGGKMTREEFSADMTKHRRATKFGSG